MGVFTVVSVTMSDMATIIIKIININGKVVVNIQLSALFNSTLAGGCGSSVGRVCDSW